MGAPREVRVHVQRVIAIPAPHNMPPQEAMGPFAPPPPPQAHQQNEASIPSSCHYILNSKKILVRLDKNSAQLKNLEFLPGFFCPS